MSVRVATRGESQLDYLLPGVKTAIQALRADARAEGIETRVADYGGARTESIVAQLITWRDEAVASGQPFYRVSPFAKGKHGVGGACDLKVTKKPAGMTDAQAYARLGALCGRHGLVWGGTFSAPSDPYHFESQQTRAQLAARWDAWTASADFPGPPASGGVAIGASNWQLVAVIVLLAVVAYVVTHRKR